MPQEPMPRDLEEQQRSPSRDGNPLISLFLDSAKHQAATAAAAQAVERMPDIGVDPFGLILGLLGAPAAATQSVLAPAAGFVQEVSDPIAPPGFDLLPGGRSLNPLKIPAGVQTALKTPMTQEAFREHLESESVPTQLAAEVGTDPLTYLGAGGPGVLGRKLMPLLPKLGVADPAAQARVLGAFDYLNTLDKAAAEAPWKATKKGFEGITGAIGDVRIPESLGLKVYADDSSSRAARTIGEFVGSESRQSLHKKFTGQIKDIVQRLGPKGMGLQLDELIAKQQMYDQIQPVSGRGEAISKLNDAIKDLDTLATDDFSTAVVDGIRRLTKGLKTHAQITTNSAQRNAATPAEALAIKENAILDLYWDAMSVIQGGKWLIKRPPKGADFAAATAPGSKSAQVDAWLADALAEGRMAREGRIMNPITRYDDKVKGDVLVGWETKKPGRSIASAHLPDDIAKIMDREWPNFVRGMNALDAEKTELAKALEDAWVAGRGADPLPPGLAAGGMGDDAYRNTINPVLTGLGKNPVTNVKELMDQFRGLFVGDVQRTKKLEDIITKWKDGEDLFRANPFDLVGGSVMREKATQFGIKPKTGVVKVLSDVTNAWKESVLMSGSYPLTNMISGVSGAALEGVDPKVTIRGLWENLPKAAAGEEIHSSKATNVAQALGVPLPADQSSLLNEANAVHEMTGEGMSVLQKWGPLKTALGGGIIGGAGGALQPDVDDRGEAIAAGAIGGAALGASLPMISKYMQRIIRGAEIQMREDAWTVGTVAGVQKHLPELRAQIDQALATRTPHSVPGTHSRAPANQFEPQYHATEADWKNLDLTKLHPGSRYGRAFYSAHLPEDAIWTVQGARQHLPQGINIRPYEYPKSMKFATPQEFDDATKKFGGAPQAINNLRSKGYDGVRDDWQTAVWEGSLHKIRHLLTKERLVPKKPKMTTTPLSPTVKARARTALDQLIDVKGGLVSPNEVVTELIRSGVPPVQARNVGKFWRNAVHEASQEGTALTSRIHVNYEKLTNLEQAMKTGVPFATWPIKMTPFFAEHILSRPSVALGLIKLNQISEQAQKEQGLTPRFKGAMEIPLGSAVYSWLIGEPVRAFFNPIKGFLPMSDANRMSDRAMESFSEGDPVRGAYELAGAAGLGPHPMIDFGLRQLWSDTPARGVIRQAEPLRGLEAVAGLNKGRGYDLNSAFTGIESIIRKSIHGSRPPDLRENAILRRIDEMAVSETGTSTKSGDARVGEFVAAKQRKSGEIWDEAAAYVAKQRAAQTGVGFLYGAFSPQAILTEEEAEIRGAQAEQDDPENVEGQIETLRGALQAMRDQGMGNDRADPELVANVVNMVVEHRENDPAAKPISPSILKATLVSGTWDSLARLVDLAFPPNAGAAGGYGASGMPDVSGITNEMQVYTNIGALAQDAGMLNDAERLGVLWDKYQRSNAQSRKTMETQAPWASDIRKIKSLRENYLAAHPELARYLNQAEPGESIDRFVTRTRREN